MRRQCEDARSTRKEGGTPFGVRSTAHSLLFSLFSLVVNPFSETTSKIPMNDYPRRRRSSGILPSFHGTSKSKSESSSHYTHDNCRVNGIIGMNYRVILCHRTAYRTCCRYPYSQLYVLIVRLEGVVGKKGVRRIGRYRHV